MQILLLGLILLSFLLASLSFIPGPIPSEPAYITRFVEFVRQPIIVLAVFFIGFVGLFFT